jgi:hypothetical protein
MSFWNSKRLLDALSVPGQDLITPVPDVLLPLELESCFDWVSLT